MAKVTVNPGAELESRDNDIVLSPRRIAELSLFAQLKMTESTLKKFPGAVVLRRYRKGEEVFRQGEPGWTAFYLLTSEDTKPILERRLLRPDIPQAERRELEKQAAENEQRVQIQKARPDDRGLRQVAKVSIAYLKSKRTGKNGLLRMLNMRGLSFRANEPEAPFKNEEGQTIYKPVDGANTGSYEAMSAPLFEGELFGEMSCLYRTPRSGTVVVQRDCFILEFLRNILDQIQKNKTYQEKAGLLYKQRILNMQTRRLSLFDELSQAEFDGIRDQLDLVNFDPGSLIFDEHDRDDCLYLLRTGLIKVVKNVSSLVAPDEVNKWPEFVQALRDAETPTPGDAQAAARGQLWQRLPERIRSILRQAGSPPQLNSQDRADTLAAFNQILKTPKLVEVKEFSPLLTTPSLEEKLEELLERRQELLKKRKDLSDQDNRKLNRQVVETLFPPEVLHRLAHAGPERILTYLTPGAYLGEICLLERRPHSATCIAYGHPNDYGQVELVRIPGKVFLKLFHSNPKIKEVVTQEMSKRKQRTLERLLTPVWDDLRNVQFTERFEELGLIQGQQLMLIDLERCTRCDECVKACVAAHDDGRSRLFLDGPRFGRYLVPTTCRSCLDPVCLIGCPVGSIHRGSNREIEIEDWCIGCGLCSDNCPYGSIKMHDLGQITFSARGWRFLPAAVVTDEAWKKPGYKDSAWLAGVGPFFLDRALRDEVMSRLAKNPQAIDKGIAFRYEFALRGNQLADDKEFVLQLTTQSPAMKVFCNGCEITPDEKPKRGRHEYTLPTLPGMGPNKPEKLLRTNNVIAVHLAPTANGVDVLLQARLDEVRRPKAPPTDITQSMMKAVADEIEEKMVTERAVVCDLCSSLPGKQPSCVVACPHSAAMRVNARYDFPAQ